MFAGPGLYQTLLESRNQFCRHELDCDFSWSLINPAASLEIPALSETTHEVFG